MYAGGFLHADDICTLTANLSSLETQISTVKNFADENFLRLNTSKCEIIVFKKSFTKANGENLEIGGNSLSVGCEATCLGYRWRQDLSSSSTIQDRIQRARRPSFITAVFTPFKAS